MSFDLDAIRRDVMELAQRRGWGDVVAVDGHGAVWVYEGGCTYFPSLGQWEPDGDRWEWVGDLDRFFTDEEAAQLRFPCARGGA